MRFMFNLEDYETVSDRVARFQKLHLGGRIVTQVVSLDNVKGEVLAKAEVYREHEDTQPAGVDYAFGIAATYPQSMRKFYVEDTVTSAVGRALSLVLDTDKKPTREDMQKVKAHNEVKATIDEVKAKMASTSGEYIPVVKEDDPWTIKPATMPPTMGEAVATVKEIIGGQTEKDIPRCPHGEMHWKTGTTKAGKPWGHFKCSNAVTGELTRCPSPDDVIWYEINKETGAWQRQKARG
jgi:hypothetical protein